MTEEKTRDAATGITTETRTSSVALPTVMRRNCGLVVDEEVDGVIRYYTYDPFGRNVRTEKADGSSSSRIPVSESVYNAFGDVVLSALYTNANDVATEAYAYDCFCRKVLTVNTLGVETVTTYDAYGNVMEYRAADGSLAASYVYDAFGRTVSQSGPLADAFRFRYSTKSFERETRLYCFGERYYSQNLRKWLTRDPLEEDGGLNLYGFCLNNPICRIDADGCMSVASIIVVIRSIL